VGIGPLFNPVFCLGLLRRFVAAEQLYTLLVMFSRHLKTSGLYETSRASVRLRDGMEMLCECVMERTELVKRLEQLDLQVWDITQQVSRQRNVITKLNEVGMDTNEPQLLLSRLENMLIRYLHERENLRQQIAKLDSGPTQEPKRPDR